MVAYLRKVKQELSKLQQITRSENNNADGLVWLVTLKYSDLLKVILVEVVEEPTINKTPE